MKKTLLLSGVACACLAVTQAEAMSWNINDYRPYVGAEYVYSYVKQGSDARHLKKDFNSGKADFGMQLYKNYNIEFSYQQSGELKSKTTYSTARAKNYFSVYALDIYGKYPILCSGFGVLGTVGTAIYHAKYKNLPKSSYDRVGYRAGIGLQYDFNTNFAARVVGRYSYIGSEYTDNMKEVTAGILYRF
jgi:opacity protein-like surface antigen